MAKVGRHRIPVRFSRTTDPIEGPCVYLLVGCRWYELPESPFLIKIGSSRRLAERIRELRAEIEWLLMGVIPCSSERECRLLERATLAGICGDYGGRSRERFRVAGFEGLLGRCDA